MEKAKQMSNSSSSFTAVIFGPDDSSKPSTSGIVESIFGPNDKHGNSGTEMIYENGRVEPATTTHPSIMVPLPNMFILQVKILFLSIILSIKMEIVLQEEIGGRDPSITKMKSIPNKMKSKGAIM